MTLMRPVMICSYKATPAVRAVAYVGCEEMAEAMRGWDTATAFASFVKYAKIHPTQAKREIAKRTAAQQALIDQFMIDFAEERL